MMGHAPVLQVHSGSVPATHSPSYDTSSTSSSHSLRIAGSASSSRSDQLLLKRAERAVSLRLLPPLLLLVVISYLDRTALSFASIQLSQDLQLSSSIYGLGSGVYGVKASHTCKHGQLLVDGLSPLVDSNALRDKT